MYTNPSLGLFGAFEDLSLDEIKAQFETNFFGVVRVTQHVLPIMRTMHDRDVGDGIVVNVDSINGKIAVEAI